MQFLKKSFTVVFNKSILSTNAYIKDLPELEEILQNFMWKKKK